MRTVKNKKSSLIYGAQTSINFTSLGIGSHNKSLYRSVKRRVLGQPLPNCHQPISEVDSEIIDDSWTFNVKTGFGKLPQHLVRDRNNLFKY